MSADTSEFLPSLTVWSQDLGKGAKGCGPPPCFYAKLKPTKSRKVMFKPGVLSNSGYG